MSKPWFVYMLLCADGSYYTGITTDPGRRLAQHNAGKGCRFTAGRRPVRLVFCEEHAGQSEARKRELQIQPMSRTSKQQLVSTQQSEAPPSGPSG
jgi:putative endonuclease